MTTRRCAHQRLAVEDALREHGPLTAEQIDKLLDWKAGRAGTTIANARFTYPLKAFRIVELIPAAHGTSRRPLAVFDLGTGADVPRLGKRSKRKPR